MSQSLMEPGSTICEGLPVDEFGVAPDRPGPVPAVRLRAGAKRADRLAGVAGAGRGSRHIQQAAREVEVAGLDQLNEPLTFPECAGVRVAEDGVPFELHESQRRRQPLADKRGQFTNNLMRMLEFNAGKKRCVAGNVGKKQVALPGPAIVRATHSRHLTSNNRIASSKPLRRWSPRSEKRKPLPASRCRTGSGIRISPGPALAATREATITVARTGRPPPRRALRR